VIWCWVSDLATRHRYDIPLQRLDHLEAIDAVREIPGRRRVSAGPRPAKHYRDMRSLRPATRPAKPKE